MFPNFIICCSHKCFLSLHLSAAITGDEKKIIDFMIFGTDTFTENNVKILQDNVETLFR